MFAFLRKVRKSLIVSGSTRKYILYAVGEIALVVIGILIALQVNNWNNQTKDQQKLNGYLQTIKSNINDDLVQLEALKYEMDSVRGQCLQAMWLLDKSTFTPQEAEILYYSLINSFELNEFNCNVHGFEGLKVSGLLDLLQGTELESLLFEYYKMSEVINHKEIRWNTYTQGMQEHVMKSEYAPKWVKNNVRVNRNPELLSDPEAYKEIMHVLKNFFGNPAVMGLYTKMIGDHELDGIYLETSSIGHEILALIDQR